MTWVNGGWGGCGRRSLNIYPPMLLVLPLGIGMEVQTTEITPNFGVIKPYDGLGLKCAFGWVAA